MTNLDSIDCNKRNILQKIPHTIEYILQPMTVHLYKRRWELLSVSVQYKKIIVNTAHYLCHSQEGLLRILRDSDHENVSNMNITTATQKTFSTTLRAGHTRQSHLPLPMKTTYFVHIYTLHSRQMKH